jgi:hypothetical protein
LDEILCYEGAKICSKTFRPKDSFVKSIQGFNAKIFRTISPKKWGINSDVASNDSFLDRKRKLTLDSKKHAKNRQKLQTILIINSGLEFTNILQLQT